MRRDVLIRGGEVTVWSNENHTGLAPGASLISEADWRLLVGEPVDGETFEQRWAIWYNTTDELTDENLSQRRVGDLIRRRLDI